MPEWTRKAAELADDLGAAGYLRTQPWRDAITAVPRHVLVPYYYVQNDDASWSRQDVTDDDQTQGLDVLYSDTTLITALAGFHPQWGSGQIAVSSSTAPALMVSMLETLDIRGGMR
ncbi:MAG: hypothetical protein ACRDQ5_22115, partial [Sciscionella sp.]